MNKKNLSGEILILLSSSLYGMYGILSRYTSEFDSFIQPLFRYLFVIVIIAIIFIIKKQRFKKIASHDTKWFLAWLVPASIQPILTFVSFKNLPVGTVYFLIYFTMIIGGIISGLIFFKERLSNVKIISIITVLIGVYLIFSSEKLSFSNIYVITSSLSGFILGFWNTLSKKISGNYPTLQMMFFDASSAIIVSLILLSFIPQPIPSLSYVGWLWLFVFAISGMLATFSLISGFKRVEAQIGSLIMPLELVFASVFGFIFLGEKLSPLTYFGGLLIFISSILPIIFNTQNEKNI